MNRPFFCFTLALASFSCGVEEADTSGDAITFAPISRPDLVFVETQQSYCGLTRNPAYIPLTVKNVGTLAAGASSIRIEYQNAVHSLADLLVGASPVYPLPALNPGEAWSFFVTPPPGCYQPDCFFKLSVDPQRVVPEWNEMNNAAFGGCLGANPTGPFGDFLPPVFP